MFKQSARLVVCAAALLAVTLAASTYAFAVARYDDLTFSAPVALPGVVLPAGTYRFEIANPDVNQDIVRVSDPATRRIYFTAHTVRVPRPRTLPKGHVITFGEAPEGSAPPIRIWYPLYGDDGRQFRY